MITTARLTLVLPGPQHLDAHAAFYASPRAAELGWQETMHQSWRNFASVIGHFALRGFGPFVAERDGQPIGLFGPWHPGGQAEAEIKWILWDAASEGQGLAHEATLATRTYAYDALGWDAAASFISPDNARSQALARKLGAAPERDWTTPSGKLVTIWRHPGPEGRTSPSLDEGAL